MEILNSRSSRRRFLWVLGSFGLASAAGFAKKMPATIYRLQTPECQVCMTIKFFESMSVGGFYFRDQTTNHTFCLSGNGEENRNCLVHFRGSMAVVTYRFRSLVNSYAPALMRETVVTIDHDLRMVVPSPFEKALAIERGYVSDIQAFGYDSDKTDSALPSRSLWCILRQNLYLNNKSDPFLIVHWKHTFDSISILDMIPGEETQLLDA